MPPHGVGAPWEQPHHDAVRDRSGTRAPQRRPAPGPPQLNRCAPVVWRGMARGMPLSPFHPAVARWFARELGEPTEPQRLAWPAIARGEHALIAAPTGSGKTLAAFLSAIDTLVREGLEGGLPN